MFTFDGRRFVWNAIVIERLGSRERLEYLCRGTVRPIYCVPDSPIAPGSAEPLPATSSWFTSLADAHAAGCHLAVNHPTPWPD